jgi:ABC-type glycerol-3-phosphate transport system substrate-binding protein
MIEIELSYTWGNDDPTFAALAEEFSQEHGVKVRLRRLDWATAWAELFTMASKGQGSDVSNIGSTWVTSLAKMNVLRPFKPKEINEIGGESAFAVPLWESAKLDGDQRVWSIPWISWMYIICYRRDILQSLGIDPSQAFATPQNTRASLAALKKSPLEIPWLNPDIPHPYIDLIHTAASWVWATDGEFIDAIGRKVLFDSPEAISGLTYWLDTYRSVPEPYQSYHADQCAQAFLNGRAAALLTHIHAANLILNATPDRFKHEDIGFSNLTHTPWSGGDSFIVWEHTRRDAERERLSVELVKYMTTKSAGLRWMQNANLLPARIDALLESYPEGNPLREVVVLAAKQGRSYENAPHWRRVEAQFCLALNACVKEARENPSVDSATTLRNRLEPLAKNLNSILDR